MRAGFDHKWEKVNKSNNLLGVTKVVFVMQGAVLTKGMFSGREWCPFFAPTFQKDFALPKSNSECWKTGRIKLADSSGHGWVFGGLVDMRLAPGVFVQLAWCRRSAPITHRMRAKSLALASSMPWWCGVIASDSYPRQRAHR